MRLFDPFPRPRVGRPVRHRFALPQRLVRGIPPTVLSRRRDAEAQHDERLPFAEALEAQAQRIAETIRQRLRELRLSLHGFGAWRNWP